MSIMPEDTEKPCEPTVRRSPLSSSWLSPISRPLFESLSDGSVMVDWRAGDLTIEHVI